MANFDPCLLLTHYFSEFDLINEIDDTLLFRDSGRISLSTYPPAVTPPRPLYGPTHPSWVWSESPRQPSYSSRTLMPRGCFWLFSSCRHLQMTLPLIRSHARHLRFVGTYRLLHTQARICMPTISGLRRRGYIREIINKFCNDIGSTREMNEVEMAMLPNTAKVW